MMFQKALVLIGVIFAGLSCESNISHNLLDAKMNEWHNDVATFELDRYFEFMDESFIFLGTAPGERWTKTEFYNFSKPYFAKEKTWDFKTIDRNWYYSEDGKTAWFEENLDTWMQDCRGSGVLVYLNDEWKIVHYNLTVLVENEKIQDFISLRKSK